jgi:hypothetical protein
MHIKKGPQAKQTLHQPHRQRVHNGTADHQRKKHRIRTTHEVNQLGGGGKLGQTQLL